MTKESSKYSSAELDRLKKIAQIKSMAGKLEFAMTADELRHNDHRLGTNAVRQTLSIHKEK